MRRGGCAAGIPYRRQRPVEAGGPLATAGATHPVSCGLWRRTEGWGGNLQPGEHASRVEIALVPRQRLVEQVGGVARTSCLGAARDEDQVDPGTHNAFGDPSCTPVACVSCNGETLLAGVVATDSDTEHGGTDANKRDGARQLGRLNVADLQL
jgi:hypothetical protein